MVMVMHSSISCGIKQLCALATEKGLTKENASKRIRAAIYNFHLATGSRFRFVIASINEYQQNVGIDRALEEAGFRCIDSDINPNTGNRIYIYLRKIEYDDKDCFIK